MRVGVSDTKNVRDGAAPRRHRIILPVYIPRLTGYFTDALEIVSLCLESVRLTAGPMTKVTVIANECVYDALALLQRHYDRGWIDQLVINRGNQGRIDAVLSAARGAHEPLLTLSDSDVLFKADWTTAIEQLMDTFPECGMASVVPHPGTAWHHTSATMLGGWLNGELGMAKVVSDADIDRFGHSIGVPDWVKPDQRARQMIVSRKGVTACVGCGHFVFTLRKEVLASVPPEPCDRPLGAGSDELWYDRPPDIGGYWRLATPTAYACHMGNVPEPWMYDDVRELSAAQPFRSTLPPIQAGRLPLASRIPWRARQILAGGLKRLPPSLIARAPRPQAAPVRPLNAER